jgi:hypothetical protein
MLELSYLRFREHPFEFEACASHLAQMCLPEIVSVDLTKPSRDGGRDAIGNYRIGFGDSFIDVDFALEAKCYNFSNSVDV